MNKKLAILPFLCAIICFISCKNSNSNTNSTLVEQVSKSKDFPQVEVPKFLNSKQEAVYFLVNNFWKKYLNKKRIEEAEAINDSTTILGVDSLKFVQAYGLYINILSFASYDDSYKSLRALYRQADSLALCGNKKFLSELLRQGEQYLYYPNSPYLNEELYIPIVEQIMQMKSLNSLDKMQYEYQKKMLLLNRVGTKANNFEFTQMIGDMTNKSYKKGSLYSIKSKYTIIFFNNPGCNSCSQITKQIMNNQLINNMISKGDLVVLSIYIDEQTQEWESYRKNFPSNWLYTRDHKLILRNSDIYGIRAIPSLYLLDKDKKVLLKDASVEKLIQYFS